MKCIPFRVENRKHQEGISWTEQRPACFKVQRKRRQDMKSDFNELKEKWLWNVWLRFDWRIKSVRFVCSGLETRKDHKEHFVLGNWQELPSSIKFLQGNTNLKFERNRGANIWKLSLLTLQTIKGNSNYWNRNLCRTTVIASTIFPTVSILRDFNGFCQLYRVRERNVFCRLKRRAKKLCKLQFLPTGKNNEYSYSIKIPTPFEIYAVLTFSNRRKINGFLNDKS